MGLTIDERQLFESPVLLVDTNKQQLICHTETGELIFREISGKSPGAQLPRQSRTYAAALDSYHNTHVVVVEKGVYYHLQPVQRRFSEQAFFQEKEKQCSHLLLAGDSQGRLHLLYLAVDLKTARWWLLHHCYSGEKWEEQRVIDFGSGSGYNYGSLVVDRLDGLHLVYRIENSDAVSLYYRYYSSDTLTWSKAHPLSTAENLSYPAITTDKHHNLHVTWAALQEEKYVVCYRRRVSGGWPGGGWQPEIVVSPRLPEPPFPFFTVKESEAALSWLSGSMVSHYRLGPQGFNHLESINFKQPVLLRICSPGPVGLPAPGWLFSDGLPSIKEYTNSKQESDTAPAGEVMPAETELEPYFTRLQQYSGQLIDQAAHLSSAKLQMEQALEEKKKEMAWITRQNQKRLGELQQALTEKDEELARLEQRLNQTIAGLKSKTELSRKVWNEERKQYLEEIKELKKERQSFEQFLRDKENTINRLGLRCRQLEDENKLLRQENKVLAIRVMERESGLKGWFSKLLQNKPSR